MFAKLIRVALVYEPVVYHRVPVIEYTKPSHGGKFAGLKDKMSFKKKAKHSKLGKLKSKTLPSLLGFKLGAITLG